MTMRVPSVANRLRLWDWSRLVSKAVKLMSAAVEHEVLGDLENSFRTIVFANLLREKVLANRCEKMTFILHHRYK